MTSKLTFEDRLLDQLRQVVATNPAPSAPAKRRWPQRRSMLASAGVAAATVGTAVVVMAGSGASKAYAVDTEPNGIVTVHIMSLSDASGLQSSLRAAGIPAVVSYFANCTLTAPAPDGVQQAPVPPVPAAVQSGTVTAQVSREADGVTFKLDPGEISPDQKVFITTATGQIDSIGIAIGSQPPPAAC